MPLEIENTSERENTVVPKAAQDVGPTHQGPDLRGNGNGRAPREGTSFSKSIQPENSSNSTTNGGSHTRARGSECLVFLTPEDEARGRAYAATLNRLPMDGQSLGARLGILPYSYALLGRSLGKKA